MSTITLNSITSGYNVNKINDNFNTILGSVNTDLVHVAGGQNTMGQDLDLNSHKLLNVGEVDASLIKLNGLPITTSQFVLGNNVVGQANMQVAYDASLTKVVDLASTATGQGAALIGWPLHFGINQPASNQFFTQNGAAVNRFPDRSFFGGATLADGTYPQISNDWLSTFYIANGYPSGYTAVGHVMIENGTSPNSGEALVCAAHSQHFTSVGTSAIGLTSVGVNDNSTLATEAWGAYFEGHHVSSTAASTYALELGIRSTIFSGAATPYSLGAIAALQLEAGAGTTPVGQFDASAYVQMANGTTKAQTGINFCANSLTGTDGVTGTATAIAFAKGHSMQWYATGGALTGRINCQGTVAANSVQLQLADGILQVQSRSNGSLQHVFNVADANVNYLAYFGSLTGVPAAIAVNGTDTNIDFKLVPKGTGLLQFGNAGSASANGAVATVLGSVGPTGSHTTVQEWLTIKNSAGTVRYIPCF